jgi:hypothetical protein
MITEFYFKFNELVIDRQEIVKILGYANTPLPSPFDGYMEEALNYSEGLNDIRGICRQIDNIQVNRSDYIIVAADQEFSVGKTLSIELRESENLAFFVCTAGNSICERSVRLMKGEDPVLGYLYDLLGSAIAEAAADRLQDMLKKEFKKNGQEITNRYSPGYCHWNVSDQHKLFSLFQGNPCGVTLTPSSLMQPTKSISGVIGIGKNVKYREYQCEHCSNKDCVYRKHL